MSAPRNWQTLARHPLSAQYPDLAGRAWEDFLEGVRTHGVVSRKITLFEGKVLSGWQLQRACVELNIKPDYQAKPDNISAEDFVQLQEDFRRHEPLDRVQKRIDERRERVAKARREGQSRRAIAEAEGVSEATIRNDLAASGAQGCAPEPESGQITGKDGKKYNAARRPVAAEALGDAAEEPLLCPRCQRVGATAGCEKCKQVQAKANRASANRGKRAKSGTQTYKLREFDQPWGVVYRQVDVLGKQFGQKESKDAQAVRDALGNARDLFHGWHKSLTSK